MSSTPPSQTGGPSSPASCVKMMFSDFCETTGLHGWKYLARVPSGGRWYYKVLWLMIVLASLAVASIFLYTAVVDFTSSTVVTTIATNTAPLSEVYFPSVIICSINQIRKSLFRGLEVEQASDIQLLLETFYSGREELLSGEEREVIRGYATREKIVKKLMLHWHLISSTNSTDRDAPENRNLSAYLDTWESFLEENRQFIEPFDFIRDLAVEDPGDSPVIMAKFGSSFIPPDTTSFLPFFGTDIGLCAVIKPQVTFSSDMSIRELPWDQKLFAGPDTNTSEGFSTFSWGIKKGAKVGKYNGLTLLLDAETYDYMYQIRPSEGFKLSIQHHLDQPLMQINEIDVSPGFETQVAVSPTLYTTTDAAKRRFSPSERGCYADREVTLQHLPYGMYRYDIGNCLFEAAYEEVLQRCACTPYFHWATVNLTYILEHRPFCKGPSLLCMNEVLGQLGEIGSIQQEDREDKVQCLAACEDQMNQISISQSKLPNRATLIARPEFCLVVARLRKSCGGYKREGLERSYPGLCVRVEMPETKKLCWINTEKKDSSGERIQLLSSGPGRLNQLGASSADPELVELVYSYSRDNLALVNVYIKNPVVTKIRRDQKIPVIWFVANSGGILGLCMGFSMVTVFEVLHYISSCAIKVLNLKLKKMKTVREAEERLPVRRQQEQEGVTRPFLQQVSEKENGGHSSLQETDLGRGSCSSCPNFVHQEDFNNALKNCTICTTSLTQCHFKCDICVKCQKCEMHMKNMHHHLPCLDRRLLAVGLPCLLACDRNMEHSKKAKLKLRQERF